MCQVTLLRDIHCAFSARWGSQRPLGCTPCLHCLGWLRGSICVGPFDVASWLPEPGRRGGGLATLVRRGLLIGDHPAGVLQHLHFLGLVLELSTSDYLVIVNVHLPPALSPSSRRVVLEELRMFLQRSGSWTGLVGGDFNDDVRPRRSTWLRTSLAKWGPLEGFWVPYPQRPATNQVITRRGSSATALDWVLLSPTWDWMVAGSGWLVGQTRASPPLSHAVLTSKIALELSVSCVASHQMGGDRNFWAFFTTLNSFLGKRLLG